MHNIYICGPGSSVGIETELRAGRSGIESRCGTRFSAPSRSTLEPTQSPVKWLPGLSRGYSDSLWAGRSGIESWWGRDFLPFQTGPATHPVSCTMGTVSFPGVKSDRTVLLTTHHLLVPRSWKSRAIPLPTLWDTPGL